MMKLSISTHLLTGDLDSKFRQAADAGFTWIDINEADVISTDLSSRDISKLAQRFGLSVNKYQPFYDLEGARSEKKEQNFSHFEFFLKTASSLNASMVLIGSSPSTDPSIDFDDIVEDLKRAAERADYYGLKIAYLGMPWASRIANELQAYEVVEAVNHQSFGLALNSYFSLADGSKSAKLKSFDMSKVFSVQIADAPLSQFDISQLKQEFACLPDLGELNLPSFIKILCEAGYDGFWSLARMGKNSGNDRNTARNGYRALLNVLDRSADLMPRNSQTKVKPLADRAKLGGIEFLEFAVDEQSAEDMRDLLKSMAFRLERAHKNQPIEFWRQGAINIVLNLSNKGFASEVFKRNGPGLCDLGLRVHDANKTIERAQAIGVEPFETNPNYGELNIPAFKGAGASLIHFFDEKTELHRVWDIEFDPVENAQIPEPMGLRRVDHLAMSMDESELDGWLLFFLCLFDFKKTPLMDINEPGGLVYSRALESPEGEVRLNLNGATSLTTLSGAFLADRQTAGIQHIAFATDDIFETSDKLNNSGFHRLAFSSNYYDSIQASYGLLSEFRNKLEAGSILYSRNESGEFFQIYSQRIWNGLFVEIVERRGGYQGYGARNAPIRLAAQQRVVKQSNQRS